MDELEVRISGSATELEAAAQKSVASTEKMVKAVEAASATIEAAFGRVDVGAARSADRQAAAARDFASAYRAAVESVQDSSGALQRAYQHASEAAQRGARGQGQAAASYQASWAAAFGGGTLRNAYQQAIDLSQKTEAAQRQAAQRGASWGAAFERTMLAAGQTAGAAASVVGRAGVSIGHAFDVAGRSALYLNQTVQLASAGITAVSAVIDGTIGQTARQGDVYQDLSRRLGVSVEFLSRFGFAAQQAGVPLEDLGGAFKSMAGFIAAGAVAGSDANKILAEGLGFTAAQIRDLQTLAPDQAMLQLGAAFDRTADSAQKTADMSAVFGRGYQSVLAIIKDGPEALRENIQLAERLGLTWTTQTAAAGDRLGDAVGSLRGGFQGLSQRILGTKEVLDPLSAIIERTALKVADLGRNIPQQTLDNFRKSLLGAADAGATFITRGIDAVVAALPRISAALADASKNMERYIHAAQFITTGALAGAVAGAVSTGPVGAVGGAVIGGLGAAVASPYVNPVPTAADRDGAATADAERHNRALEHRREGYGRLIALAEKAGNVERANDLRRQQSLVPMPGAGGFSPVPVASENYTPAPGSGSNLPIAPPNPGGGAVDYGRSTTAGDSAAKDALAAAKKHAQDVLEIFLREKRIELDRVRENAEARLQIEQRYTKEIGETYGTTSKAYQDQLHDQSQAEREVLTERAAISRVAIQATRDRELAELQIKKDADLAALDAGTITQGEYLQRLQSYYDRRRDVIKAALDAEGALGVDTPVQAQERRAAGGAADTEHKVGTADVTAQGDEFRTEALKGYAAAYDEMWTNISTSSATAINSMVLGQQRFGLVARNMSRQIAGNFLQMGVRMVTGFIADIGKMILAWVFGETVKTNATVVGTSTRRGVESAANKASILEYAIIAFGAAYQAAAAIPFVGWILGPIAGAVAFAAVMGMGAGIGSAEGGWGDVPADGTPAILHKREMVLPASIASAVRDMAAGHTGGGRASAAQWTLQAPSLGRPEFAALGDVLSDRVGNGGTSTSADGDAADDGGSGRSVTHITIQAMDAASVARFIRQPGVAGAFSKGMKRHARLEQGRP